MDTMFRSQPASVNAGILHCAVVFLFLTLTEAAESQTVQASVGDDVTLSCHMNDAVDPVNQMVEWSRPGLTPRFVHVRRFGSESLTDQNPSYKGRTSVSVDGVKHGDVSLKLSRVKLSDEGTYRCFVPELKTESVVQLVVRAVAEVTAVGSGVLECRSGGWFPEPELLWLDAEGNLLSAGPTETVRGSDDLYTVSSRVTVEKRHSSRYTCRVQQRSINQKTEAHIHVTDEFFPKTRSPAPAIVVVVVFVVLVLVIVGWKWRYIKYNKKPNHDEEAQRSQERKNSSNSSEQVGLLENERSSNKNYTTNRQESNAQTSHDPNNGHNRGINGADSNIQEDDVTSGEETVKRRETPCPDTEHEEEMNTTSGPVEASADENKSSVNNRDTHSSGDGGTNQTPINQGDSSNIQDEYEQNKPENLTPAEDKSKPPNNKDNTNSEDQPEEKENRGDGKEQTDETSHLKDENEQNLKVDEEGNETNDHKEDKKEKPSVGNKPEAENEADGNKQQDDVTSGEETVKRTETLSADIEHKEETNTISGSVEASADENKSSVNNRDTHTSGSEGTESTCGEKEETHEGEEKETRDGEKETETMTDETSHLMDEKRQKQEVGENATNGHNKTEKELKQEHPINNQTADVNQDDNNRQTKDFESHGENSKESETADQSTTKAEHGDEMNDGEDTTSASGDAGTNQTPINQGDSLKNQDEYDKNKPENLTPAENKSKPPNNKDNTNSESASTGSTCKDEGETEDQPEERENRGDGKEQTNETSHLKDENGQNLKVDEGGNETNDHKEDKKEKPSVGNKPAAENEADGNKQQDDVTSGEETVKRTETLSADIEHKEETNTTSGSVEASADENKSSVNNRDTHSSGSEGTKSTCGEKEETHEDHPEEKETRDGDAGTNQTTIKQHSETVDQAQANKNPSTELQGPNDIKIAVVQEVTKQEQEQLMNEATNDRNNEGSASS